MDVEDEKPVDVDAIKGRFDVTYGKGGVSIEPHFCREWDDEGGCFGTNPDHGLSVAEACDEIACWHERQAKMWRSRTHPDLRSYDPEYQGSNEEMPNDF